jgi:hypothetical protein
MSAQLTVEWLLGTDPPADCTGPGHRPNPCLMLGTPSAFRCKLKTLAAGSPRPLPRSCVLPSQAPKAGADWPTTSHQQRTVRFLVG